MFLLNWFNYLFTFLARERVSLIFVRGDMMSIFPPKLFDATTRHCNISDAALRIRDAEAAAMVCMSWIPLSLLPGRGGITDHISTFILLGCRNWQFEGILPSSILCSKLVGIFPKLFLLRMLLAMILHPQYRQIHQYSHWWCSTSISGLVLESDQDDCPLPIQMILIDIDLPDPWKNLLHVCHYQ